MQGEDMDALVADIKANGIRQHIALWRGKILDGRNRYRAALKAGVDPLKYAYHLEQQRWVGKSFDPAAYVISKNIHRRHLTTEQRREVVAKVIKAQPEKSNRQIAKTTGVSHPHVAKVRGELEKSGDVETVTTSIDTKGRAQPAKKKAKKAAVPDLRDAKAVIEQEVKDVDEGGKQTHFEFMSRSIATLDDQIPF
jgi:ParB-like chromosome segregation protein Spo0J